MTAEPLSDDLVGAKNLIAIFWDSGWVGRGVFVFLVAFSLASWYVIFSKWMVYGRATRATRKFLAHFHKSKRFSEVAGVSAQLGASPLVGLFQAAHAELDAQVKRNQTDDPAGTQRFRIKNLSGIERALQRSASVESRHLSRWLWVLATTAAASPFVGLFGTVWGIMGAFEEIGRTGSTSIVAVAPGISEALINTAAGLAAAIPALVAYNLCQARVKEFRSEMEDFAMEFLALTERNFM